MISFVSGKLAASGADFIVIETGGFGIRVNVPPAHAGSFGRIGENVTAHTHLQVLESELKLYGFRYPQELGLFQLLLGVSGMGARLAMSVISAMTPSEFYQAVLTGDEKSLVRVPGIGKKMAQRLIFELSQKTLGEHFSEGVVPVEEGTGTELISALESLGYSAREVLPLIKRMKSQGTITGDISQDLKQVLRAIDGRGEGR